MKQTNDHSALPFQKIWSLVLALSLLLCACQPDMADGVPDTDSPSPESSASGSPVSPPPESQPPGEFPGETDSNNRFPPQPEASAPGFPVSPPPESQPSPGSPGNTDFSSRFPPQPEVCELAFTETDAFPEPFAGELYEDEEGEIFLSVNEALYDYNTMWLLLEENFPYLDRIEAEMGVDWRAVRGSCRAQLEQQAQASGGYLSQEIFLDIMYDCLAEFRQVGHLYIIRPDRWRDWGDNWLSFGDGTLWRAMGELVRNPRSEQFYTHWEEFTARDALKQHARYFWINGGEVSPALTVGMLNGRVPYMKISSFSSSAWTDDVYGAVSEFLSSIGDEENLIIDVRGNQGGSMEPWLSMISALTCETLTCNMFLAAKSGSLNLALNPRLGSSLGTVYEDDSWREDFPYIQPEYVNGMDMLFKYTMTAEPADESAGFYGKIWVLVDEWCYSAADNFAVFCKDTGFATLVGTTTGGNGIGAQPHVMALPYSGLVVYYEPYLSFNPDGTCNGIRGTQPDVVCRNGQSALDDCFDLILAEKK